MRAIRLSGSGWVERNSGGREPPPAAIACKRIGVLPIARSDTSRSGSNPSAFRPMRITVSAAVPGAAHRCCARRTRRAARSGRTRARELAHGEPYRSQRVLHLVRYPPGYLAESPQPLGFQLRGAALADHARQQPARDRVGMGGGGGISRLLEDGNVFERNWTDAQNGFAILMTVRNQDGGAPWSVVEDVTFSRNEKGEVTEASVQMGERTIKAKKKSDAPAGSGN